MTGRKAQWLFWVGVLLVFSGRAEVRVSIQGSNDVAWVQYECTAGELVRAFALDVSVNRGQILGILGFFRGESQAGATGYGIFPASYRDHLLAGSSTNVDWQSSQYTPLAAVADSPPDTLPGLNSSGVTLEFGGLWDPTAAATMPGPIGTLCGLKLSQPAEVSVAANGTRGGIVSAFPESTVQPIFVGAFVGPSIIRTALQDGVMTILFTGGELQTAPTVDGPWTDTGNVSGTYVEPVGTNAMRFYRVRNP